MTTEDGYDRLKLQMKADTSGGFKSYSIAIFGKPGSGKFQWELTGRHLTLRADGDSDSESESKPTAASTEESAK